jgi:protein O-GlcNAc transferase
MKPPSIAPPRLRIAFLSEFFSAHIIAEISRGIMKNLPRDRFEVLAIHVCPNHNLATVVGDFVDRIVRIDHESLASTREQIAALELDVLFFTDIGMRPTSYFLAFARLAHVQCVYGGHPVTTGIPNVDYFISSADAEPDGSAEQYSEKLVRFGGNSVYFPRFPVQDAVLPGIRQRLKLSAEKTLYTAPVSLFKFHPDFDKAIIRIMESDPAAEFLLIESTEPYMVPALLHRLGAARPQYLHRFHVIKNLLLQEFVGLLLEVDAVLDTFYFGAGTTAYFACAVGVPFITLPSPFLRGRAGIAVYEKMGILEPIAADFDDFVAKAVRLANDKPWHDSLHQQIVARSACLFDQLDFVTELTDFLATAVAAKRAGQPLVDWPPPLPTFTAAP